MLISLLAACLALQTGTASDTVPDAVPVYTPVLENLLGQAPSPPGSPVVLNATVYPGISGPANRMHPDDVLRRLVSGGKVQQVAAPQGETGCLPVEKYVTVSLGEVVHLPARPRVKVLPAEGTPGIPLDQALDAVPESEAVPVSAAVDVVLRTPCPAPAGSERCRVPDVAIYRYFLDLGPDGTYFVVTRWLTGGA